MLQTKDLNYLNGRLSNALTQVLFSTNALAYACTEHLPELLKEYKLFTGSDYFLYEKEGYVHKSTNRIPTMNDLVKELEKVQKKVIDLQLRTRMRILKDGFKTEVTENIDNAIHRVQSVLCNKEEDEIYTILAQLSGYQKNAWSLEQQMLFLEDVVLVSRRSYSDALKLVNIRAKVLRDVYENPLTWRGDGKCDVRDIKEVGDMKQLFILNALKGFKLHESDLLRCCEDSGLFKRELEVRYVISCLIEDKLIEVKRKVYSLV